ncbi:MAG: hypothetical protein PSW75_00270 [bacterium]|nr:hypothetical protein [bacterium]MDI1336481.1 hypothetical protein [Lacunisphaera sp.]
MKIIAVPFALLFTASLMSAEPAPVQPADAAKPVDPKAVSAKTVDPKAAKTVPKKDEKKKEEEPKIPGVLIPRAGGTWLAIEVIGGQFKLSFYDKKKKPAPVDVTRAIAVWPNPRAPGNNRTVLNVSGTALVGSKPVVPPYTFIVRLTLLKGDGDNAVAVENYAVQMH